MGLTIALEEARPACVDSIEAFLRAVDSIGEIDLLGTSRCHGWTRLDVVVHVVAGWQEMLGGLVSVVDLDPTVDAASYWTAFATQYATDDPVPVVMSQRRRSAAYARPSSATAQLSDVASALLRGVNACEDSRFLWQTHVFTAGDFLTVWAVEDVVHHLDLLAYEPPPDAALKLARATIETLAGETLPSTWSDLEATLIGTGRTPVPPGSGAVAARMPALS